MITIPELIWSGGIGALAGAIMAFVTTLITTRSHDKRQAQQLLHDIEQRTRQFQHDADQRRTQFEHDAEQRRTDREMGLRRDVYLEAAAATGKMQEYIASYARQDILESDKLTMIQGSTATLNKIHIVGTNRTIEAFGAVQLEFANSSIQLGKIKLDVVKRTIDIEQLQRELHLLEEKRAGILQIASDLGPSPHPGAVEDVRSRVMALDVATEKASDSLSKIQNELFTLQMTLIKESAIANLGMLNAFCGAALALREELRLGLDIDSYREFIKKQQAQLEEKFRSFIENVSEKATEEGE